VTPREVRCPIRHGGHLAFLHARLTSASDAASSQLLLRPEMRIFCDGRFVLVTSIPFMFRGGRLSHRGRAQPVFAAPSERLFS